MDPAGNGALREAIKHTHGCDAKWVESVTVKETVKGDTVFDGEVQIFFLMGHPQATRAYAWSYATEGAGRQFVAILGVGAVTDAKAAVHASLAAPKQ